ncbi:MAG: methionyl-tRNA formyltransferase [Robiginitomaculum sp.]|nr:methionyl-tRNA formyltransferase [Robiginitomaculum sp.]
MALRIAFMGSPVFATATLGELVAAGHEIVCVYTREPKPTGRGKKLGKTAVHQMADSFSLPVKTPKTLRDADTQAEFAALKIDLAVVVAYGLILPQEILSAPVHGCFNLHGSELPRWRGAAPIQRAIMAGDNQTAVQVMQMDEGLDTGDILLSENMPISKQDTTGSLHDKMMLVGADLMIRAISALQRDALFATKQLETGVTYAKKIAKTETKLNWTLPASELDWHIRGLAPSPGAWFELDTPKANKRIKVLFSEYVDKSGKPGEILDDKLTIATKQGAVRLITVQPSGGRPMSAEQLFRGGGFNVGDILS